MNALTPPPGARPDWTLDQGWEAYAPSEHQAWVTRVGGLMLVVVGVLLVTGLWDSAVTWIQIRLISDFEVSV